MAARPLAALPSSLKLQFNPQGMTIHFAYVPYFVDDRLTPNRCPKLSADLAALPIRKSCHFRFKVCKIDRQAMGVTMLRFLAACGNPGFDHANESVFKHEFVSIRRQLKQIQHLLGRRVADNETKNEDQAGRRNNQQHSLFYVRWLLLKS